MVVEAVAGFLTGSLALISDAGHMATDALGLGMALAAIIAADRAGSEGSRTYGLYRLEILAALANAVLLFAVATYVIYEALQRLQEPVEVLTTPMLVVAVVGLAVNIVGWRLLRTGAEESINVKGAYLEVLADLVGSIGVIAAALIMIVTDWPYADPLFAALIGLFILPRAWKLGGQALRVLVQAAPAGLDVGRLRDDLTTVPGVVDVHDLHVWTLTSDMDVATVHLMTREGTDPHPVLDQARSLLEDRYAIAHATLQVEPDTHQGCSEVTW
jgi:cobalt-zinc-cadmium efflux system protein